MKKFINGMALFMMLILITNSVFAGENADRENKKRENTFKSALDSYMQEFMKEDTPEEDKITAYEYSGHGWNEREENGENKIFANISFNTKPVNLENTTWYEYNNMCFAVFRIENDEYILERISRYPDNLDKFMEKFEEYKKNSENNQKESNIEVKTVQAEIENSYSSLEIKKISNSVFLVCLLVFVITLILLVKLVVKRG